MRLFSTFSLLSVTLPLAVAALDQTQMTAHLAAGAPLLGTFDSSETSNTWMSALDDAATIQSLSIPGTHDSLAWNVTGLAGAFTKTQDLPLFKQLDAGARFIDLRVGENNGQIQLYHGSVLLDPTAQLVDIFWGLYQWLDAHTSETVIVSVKVDTGNSTQTLQQNIYDAVTGQDVASYWVQSAAFPTLGEARHKAILLRRFAFDQLPDVTPVGVDASSGWSDNNAAFTITYSTNNDMLYIEDLYDLTGPDTASAVNQKAAAINANLDLASGGTQSNQMFITFVSGSSGISVTPQGLAEGNGTTTPGLNEKTLEYLAGKRGARFGAVLFDFIGSDSRLVPATLSQEVDLTASPSSEATPTNSGTGSQHLNGATGGVTLPHKAVVFTIGVTLLTATGFAFF